MKKKLELFFNNKQLQTDLSIKAHELSNSLSGNGVFSNNWKQVEQMLYE